MLTKEQLAELKLAIAEGRIAYDHENHSANYPCDHCGKEKPQHAISICETAEDVKEDPMSGEIIFLGSTCYKQIKVLVGLE